MVETVLRCLSPIMAEKELWGHLLAYNLIRLLMAQAAAQHGTTPRHATPALLQTRRAVVE